MIQYIGLVTNDNYKERTHELTDLNNFIAVTAILRDGIPDADLCALQYTIIPKDDRSALPFETWVNSSVGYQVNQIMEYNLPRTPIAAVRLHPLSGNWDFVVREINSEEITLNDAKYA
jgi:hypothetical protein